MIYLKVFYSGQILFEESLDPQKEYSIGRGDQCDIVLPKVKGISRKHSLLTFENGHWQLSILSKFGEINAGTQSQQHIEITESMSAYIQSFEFRFKLPVEEVPTPEPEIVEEDLENSKTQIVKSHEPGSDDLGATVVAPQNMSLVMVINYTDSQKETLVLEGESWTVGRDPNCEIHIDDDHISREHMILTKKRDGLYVTDLSSSNGVKVNGQRIPQEEETHIQIDDELLIKRVQIKFEIRDENFIKNLDQLSHTKVATSKDVALYNDPLRAVEDNPHFLMESGPRAERLDEEPSKWTKKNKVRAGLMAAVALLFMAILLKDDNKASNSSKAVEGDSKVKKLSKEQKKLVKDSLVLARSQYNREQFSLCISEIKKIHKLIPSYKDSKKLQNFCENGLHLAREQANNRRIDRERRITEQKVSSVITTCRDKIKSFNTIDELNICLEEAIELSPEDLGIEELRTIISKRESDKKNALERKKQYENQVRAGINHYNRAYRKYKSGKLNNAQKEYRKYLRNSYPDPQGKRKKAKRELASIRSKLSIKIKKLIKTARADLSSGKYKEAYKSSKEALSEDPQNDEAIELKDEILTKLAQSMKEKFDNASIEENYGNVDAAKELWKQIIKVDFRGGSSFYLKAKNKLRKYEILN